MNKIIVLIFIICLSSKLLFSHQLDIGELHSAEFHLYKELRLKSVDEFPEAFGSTYQEELCTSDKEWKRRLKSNMLFAKVDEEIVGMIGAVIDPREKLKHSAHIVSFYVLPNYRSHNIGTSLIKKLMDKLRKEKSIKRFTLQVSIGLPAAVRVYEKCGFEIVGILHAVYCINNIFYDHYLMVNDLSRAAVH